MISGSRTSRFFAFLVFAATGCLSISTVSACDPFSAFFGGCNDRQPAQQAFGYAAEPGEPGAAAKRVQIYGGRYSGGASAYCVRTCDGRYFPLTATGGQSRAEACRSFCPASDTRVVLGRDIDSAATESGKPYSELPNAFKYRTELVAGCTCNGKDPAGLAAVKIEDDPTLRKGDIVSGPDGLMVAGNSNRRRSAALNFSPAPRSVRAQFERLPVVAAQ
jgi:hypothetical protein